MTGGQLSGTAMADRTDAPRDSLLNRLGAAECVSKLAIPTKPKVRVVILTQSLELA